MSRKTLISAVLLETDRVWGSTALGASLMSMLGLL